MTSVRASLAVLGVAGLLWAAPAPCATPAREALVIGNGTYDALPSLPACLLSAHAVAAALRGAGFHVTEREDASSGATGGGIGEFSAQLAASPGATAFVYSCGYATTFNDRPFLLPVSVKITRPADLLTQGVLAKSLVDVLTRNGAGVSILAVDVVPAPDATGPVRLDVLIQDSLPDGLGVIGVSQTRPPDAPTPLATALLAGLKGSEAQTGALLASLQQQLAANKAVTIAARHMPVSSGYLIGGPPPPPPPRPPQPPAVATTAPTPAPAPPPAPPPAIAVPAEEQQMSDAVRRWVQTSLAKLGYYDGQIDGVFGPDTRAAIRRYQHELGADMTGRLTASQAGRLLDGH
ncbi:MAG TPA: peptidoglycan-binding protein [Acetobacteraceae bacterium]